MISFTVGSSSSSSGAGGGVQCDPPGFLQTFIVEVPPEGVPAEPGQICAAVMQPVQANRAARVTLTKYSPALELAMGFVAIDPAILPDLVGAPTITAIDAWNPNLMPMQVSNIQPTAGGFSFHAEWPAPLNVGPESWSRVTVKTTMEVKCDPQGMTTRLVESVTHINLCAEVAGDVVWVSSGDECNACDIIAEMAPSPIVPEKKGDDLPLGRALRLRVVPLSRVGRKAVLLAENDGGDGQSYAWAPSAGDIEVLADDIIVWTVPPGPGPYLLQAAVHGDDAAAVATYTWQEAL